MRIEAAAPSDVTYCHCADCRRVTGAPVAVFAAFGDDEIRFEPPLGAPISVTSGVTRWFCRDCGSPLAGRYAYLPGQTYVAIGLLDQAADLPPQMHAHAEARLPWLALQDDLPKVEGSARDGLNTAAKRD